MAPSACRRNTDLFVKPLVGLSCHYVWPFNARLPHSFPESRADMAEQGRV